MVKMRRVRDRMSSIMAGHPLPVPTSGTPSRKLRGWLFFAERYAQAAQHLESSSGEHDIVRIQLYGQAAECAIKAYLTTRQVAFPKGTKGHDLVSLAELAEANGCQFTELQAIALWQASSLFYKDVLTGTLFKSRYPTEQPESSNVLVGSFDELNEFVVSVCSQSAA